MVALFWRKRRRAGAYLKGVVDVREYKTTEQYDLDLESGRVDLIMASVTYLTAAAAKPQNADMVIVGPRFQGGMLGRGSSVGLRKSDPELKALFDDAIAAAGGLHHCAPVGQVVRV